MSGEVFGRDYASQYDLLYSGKDYKGECDALERVFRERGSGRVNSILDLGCGTGNHAFPLAGRGYEVTGVDVSTEMLARARQKFSEAPSSAGLRTPTFLIGDARAIDLGRSFDAVVMMFAVLGYQRSNKDLLAALRTVRRHLSAGGLFVCDFWYGPAVLAMRPVERVKVVETADGTLLRASNGTLDTARHTATIHCRMWMLSGRQMVCDTVETHDVRYFFPLELAFFMEMAGLDLTALTAFPKIEQSADERTWNVMAVARAV